MIEIGQNSKSIEEEEIEKELLVIPHKTGATTATTTDYYRRSS
jgi:hypothetical protein